MSKKLLIIPAKSNSRRIPGKNFKRFYNKKIIEYSIETAINSKLFETIHISTDRLSKVKKYKNYKNIDISFARPRSLCKNNTQLVDVLKYVYFEFYKQKKYFNEIWCLLPCAPLINKNDLKKASKFFNKKPNQPVLSVSRFPVPIDWAFMLMKNQKLKPVFKNKHHIPSQNLSQYFYDAGLFSIFPKDFFSKKKFNIFQAFRGFEIEREKAVDIDNIDDWNLAKKLFKNIKN